MSEPCKEAKEAAEAIWVHVNETWNSNRKSTDMIHIQCLIEAAMEKRERRIASRLVQEFQGLQS